MTMVFSRSPSSSRNSASLGDQRTVWRVGRDVGEKGIAGLRRASHEVDRLVEEDVRAVPLERLPPAIADVGVVEVVVAPEVGHGADVGGGEPHGFVESAILGPEGVVVAEVPLAEHPRPVAGFGEDVGHRGNLGPQERPTAADVDRAVASGVHAGQQLPAGRRAHRRHVEVVQAHAFAAQAVDMRRLEHGVSVGGQFAVSLIVRHHENDVGRLGEGGRGEREQQSSGKRRC